MSLAIPNIYVSRRTRGKLRVQHNAYTGDNDQRETMWRVTLNYDRFPDRSLDVWFADDAEASRFALQGLHSLTEVLKAMAPLNSAFTAQPPSREPRFKAVNQYTDQPVMQESWHSLMWNEQYGRWANLWYGEDAAGQAQAAMWEPGTAYSLFDFLRVFQVLVVVFPASHYIKEFSTGGFIDKNGFHVPGVYPNATYPGGIGFGGFIPLEVPTLPPLGYIAVLTKAQLVKLASSLGVPGWVIVEVIG